MANADYINFNVDGQKLSYTQKYYTSTGTIDTLFVRFNFKTDNSGNVRGGGTYHTFGRNSTISMVMYMLSQLRITHALFHMTV